MHSFAPKEKSPSPAAPSRRRDTNGPAKLAAQHPASASRYGSRAADLQPHAASANPRLPARLPIGAPNAAAEREADHIAEHVMGMRDPATSQRSAMGNPGPHATPVRVQMKSAQAGIEADLPQVVHEV